jgi:DNA-binding response OmpR family regulator
MSVKTDEEAFAALELNSGQDLAGLVTDINLRRPRTGWDVATRARELSPNLPVIYMSGDDGHDWPSKGVPNSTLIVKPFVPAQIVVALATLMNKSDADG